ncbi:MAG: HAD hydrolase-like protein, partial [Candidatus Methanomethylophilaceae archaeon]|nr:HAD hydrolase-like protein [Candidatus Methanomethylophilaceae archaeon]
VIGDRIYTDIKVADGRDTLSIMVLTGEATEDDIELSGIRPTFVCNSVAEIMSLGIEFQQ